MKDNLLTIFGAIIACIIIVFACVGVCCIVDGTATSSSNVSQQTLSGLDGNPMEANSVHCSHIKSLFRKGLAEQVMKDDGTIIEINLTGTTSPIGIGQDTLGPGVLCVSVPSYEDNDEDETYYFKTFKGDN